MPCTTSIPKDVVRRANKAKVNAKECCTSGQEDAWEILDKEEVTKLIEDEQDMEEWVFVGNSMGHVPYRYYWHLKEVK